MGGQREAYRAIYRAVRIIGVGGCTLTPFLPPHRPPTGCSPTARPSPASTAAPSARPRAAWSCACEVWGDPKLFGVGGLFIGSTPPLFLISPITYRAPAVKRAVCRRCCSLLLGCQRLRGACNPPKKKRGP